jgi:hypothetical protein
MKLNTIFHVVLLRERGFIIGHKLMLIYKPEKRERERTFIIATTSSYVNLEQVEMGTQYIIECYI